MVSRASDPPVFEKAQVGDTFRFRMEKVGGQWTLTQVEPGKG
jgi:hypothetical protein